MAYWLRNTVRATMMLMMMMMYLSYQEYMQ